LAVAACAPDDGPGAEDTSPDSDAADHGGGGSGGASIGVFRVDAEPMLVDNVFELGGGGDGGPSPGNDGQAGVTAEHN
ncbi:MAG: hypothetical protein KC613_27010, partial [Myxococcales bacterium]|nr:hypothetical protein [Myxococcales bacterium]